MTQKGGKGNDKASSKSSSRIDKGRNISGDRTKSSRLKQRSGEKKRAQAALDKAKQRTREQKMAKAALEKKKQQVKDGKENVRQGEKAEGNARKLLKRDLGFDRSGLGLHYGRRKAEGIDAYGIRNTPKGKTVGMVEAKSTRNPNSKGTKKEIMRSLEVDSKGLQQGSHLWNQDRLRTAARRGNRVARNIRSGQAKAGEGRIWQSRDYVYWENTSTGSSKVFRVISSSDGRKVRDLKLVKST
jgi:hypothetical protein